MRINNTINKWLYLSLSFVVPLCRWDSFAYVLYRCAQTQIDVCLYDTIFDLSIGTYILILILFFFCFFIFSIMFAAWHRLTLTYTHIYTIQSWIECLMSTMDKEILSVIDVSKYRKRRQRLRTLTMIGVCCLNW